METSSPSKIDKRHWLRRSGSRKRHYEKAIAEAAAAVTGKHPSDKAFGQQMKQAKLKPLVAAGSDQGTSMSRRGSR